MSHVLTVGCGIRTAKNGLVKNATTREDVVIVGAANGVFVLQTASVPKTLRLQAVVQAVTVGLNIVTVVVAVKTMEIRVKLVKLMLMLYPIIMFFVVNTELLRKGSQVVVNSIKI